MEDYLYGDRNAKAERGRYTLFKKQNIIQLHYIFLIACSPSQQVPEKIKPYRKWLEFSFSQYSQGWYLPKGQFPRVVLDAEERNNSLNQWIVQGGNSQSVTCRPLKVPEILDISGQNYFYNNTKTLFAFFYFYSLMSVLWPSQNSVYTEIRWT